MNPVRPLNGALERTARDFRYAVRTLRREPTFVVAVILTFALVIGTNAAMFGLVARLMLAPPPGIRDADRVSRARFSVLSEDGDSFVASTTSYPTFRLLRAQHDAFGAVAASKPDTMTVGRSPSIAQIAVLGASGDYFATLGARPALGRLFADGDDALPDGNSVLVLGYAYWQRAFDGERSVLGREIVVNDQPFTIIGVAARGFNGDELGQVDAFMPLTASMRKNDADWASNAYMNVVSIVVRLRDGVTPAAARQMASAALRDDRSAAGRLRSGGVELMSIIPGRESRQSPQARIALWLAAVSIIVLLIATTNVGTLLSLRSARRQREIAVRIAVGAGHADLARQLLIESVLLAAMGAGVGLVLSHWFSNVIRATLLPNLASGEAFVDRRVLLASIVTACLAGVVAGLAPLSQIRRTNLSAQLRSGGGQGTSGRLAFQNTLVTVQVALCTMLLIGAALFVRSLERVQSQDLGFTAANLLYVTLDFRGYVSGTERDRGSHQAQAAAQGGSGTGHVSFSPTGRFGHHSAPERV